MQSSILCGQSYKAWLVTEWSDGSTVIEGLFQNNGRQIENLTYHLIIEKKSKNGNTVSNVQSGSFQIQPQRKKLIALTELNIDELDFYRIYFKIFKKEKIIAQDVLIKWEEVALEIKEKENIPKEKLPEKDLPKIRIFDGSKLAPNNREVQSSKVQSEQKDKITDKNTFNQSGTYAERGNAKPPTLPTPISKKTKTNSKQTLVESSIKRVPHRRDSLGTLNKKEIAIASDKTMTIKQPTKEKQKETTAQTDTKKSTKQTLTKPSNPTPPTTPVNPSTTPIVPSAPAEDISINGLVIDDSRTKTGRDFYDAFYSRWEAPRGAEDFNITIKELPARGRISQVAILVNDNQVMVRLVQPRLDLIEELAAQSVVALQGYLKNAAQLRKQLETEDQTGSGIY